MKTTLALSLVLSTSAIAEKYNPFGPRDPAYIVALSNYGKEMVASRYSEKMCQGKVAYNSKYFAKDAPPNLWSQEAFNLFMQGVMVVTKNKIDEQIASVGRDQYCARFIDFIEANYQPNNYPIIIRR
jgi:hypothetical protein